MRRRRTAETDKLSVTPSIRVAAVAVVLFISLSPRRALGRPTLQLRPLPCPCTLPGPGPRPRPRPLPLPQPLARPLGYPLPPNAEPLFGLRDSEPLWGSS